MQKIIRGKNFAVIEVKEWILDETGYLNENYRELAENNPMACILCFKRVKTKGAYIVPESNKVSSRIILYGICEKHKGFLPAIKSKIGKLINFKFN